MGLGPFDLPGGAFIALYLTLLLVTIIAGVAIPRWLRPEGSAGRVSDPDQLAYLAGGAPRLADAVIARLMAAGALVLEAGGRFHLASSARGQTAAERAILQLPAPTSLAKLQRATADTARATAEALQCAGALIEDATAWQLRLLQTAPYLLLIVFGAIKWEVGTMRDRPVGILTGLLIMTALFALIRFILVDRRTRSGLAALKDAREASDRLRRAPTQAETGLAVALFGTAVLSGSAWSAYHTLRTTSSGDGGSSADGGSGCGGGGGGGGCGGCSS